MAENSLWPKSYEDDMDFQPHRIRNKQPIQMNPYTRIFKADHDLAISAGGLTALAVYIGLLRIHSDAPPGEKESFRAGAARIARHAGTSSRTVKRILPKLAAEGLITVVSGRRKDRISDHEENRIKLQGVAGRSLGRDSESLGRDSECGLNGPRKKKTSYKEVKKDRRFQRGESEASPANGYQKEIHPDFDY
jgi:DNA-binding MarR family transcriptional regulator